MGLAEDLLLIKSNLITHLPLNVDPLLLITLIIMINTDWAIHVSNEVIWPLYITLCRLPGLEIGLTVPSNESKAVV